MLGHLSGSTNAALCRRVLVASAILASAVACCGVTVGDRSAARPATVSYVLASCSGTQLSPGPPTNVFAPPSVLPRPADGRLNGYDFSLLVLGYADASCIASSQSGRPGYTAPPGESVAMVSYDLRTSAGWGTDTATGLSFVVNGRTVPIVDAGNTTGTGAYALVVPSTASVGFAVSSAGLTQELSLQSGKRVTRAPRVLYRSWNTADVTKQVRKSVTLEVVDRAQHFAQADRLELVSTVLSWFSPVDPGIHAGPAGAFLRVNLTERPPPGRFQVGWLHAVSPNRMRLVLPGGRAIAPDAASTVGVAAPDLLGGTYFFDVPWDFTRGVLDLTPGTNPAVGITGVGMVEDTVVGTARYRVSLPSPKPFPRHVTGAAGATGRAAGKGRRTIAARPHGHAGPSSGAGLGKVLVVVVPSTLLVFVTVVVVVPVLLRRRQRRLGPYDYDAGAERIEPVVGGELTSGADVAVAGSPAPDPAVARTGPGTPGAGEEEAAADAPAAPRPAPYVAVLGDVQVRNLELPTRRLIALEILCFLACHQPRRFTSDEIRSELWPLGDDGTEQVRIKTFQSYVTAARRAAGLAHFPKPLGGTYQLAPAVETDWDRFRALASRAETVTGGDRRRLLDEALVLVRGRPFSGVPKSRYEWALSGGLVSTMSIAVIAAASALVESCLADGVPADSLAGLERAFVATRDPGVGDDLLTAAGATGNLATLQRTWEEILAVLGRDAVLLQRSFEAIRNRLSELEPVD